MAQQQTQVINKAVQDFLRDAKTFKSKQDFLQKMAQYQKRFTPSNVIADRSVAYSQNKNQGNHSDFMPNPFVSLQAQKKKVVNPFKATERQNYHHPLPSYHSRSDTEFYRPAEDMRFYQTDFRGNLPQPGNLVDKQFIDPQLQELLIQQQLHNMNSQRSQQMRTEHNEFLHHYEEEPDYVKFFKRQPPMTPPPRHQQPQNPFQKR